MLGPLRFERDGSLVPVPSGRQRSLLALLLLNGGTPLSRDRLIDELWGERPPASAVSALHVHLSKLRALLDGLLVLEPGGYSLRSENVDLDASRFEALVERARNEPAAAGSLLREALTLFRGDPLSDVDGDGAIAQWRRTLEEKRLQATLDRVDADLVAGAAGGLVPELERLLSEHQFEERLWGQLMLALYRAGRQADALDAFGRARRLLAQELGLDPGEPLGTLQRRMLDHDPTLEARAPASPASEVAPAEVRTRRTPTASNLPRPLTRLVGRERELTALRGLMLDPDLRLITLIGPGGVGKTRLLLELAAGQEPGYGDGAVFVRLERLTDPSLVAAEIAHALAYRDGSEGPSADGLASYLHERELLVLIDNFEHLLGAAVLVAELLAAAPRIKVLVSSRTALRIRGEHIFEVEPLALPADQSDEEIARSPAVQLFLQCALARNRSFDISSAGAHAVASVCRALDGLPLAIELAASRSQSLSPEQIAGQLARPLSIGEHALRDLPDRQQTLQAAIRWSYDLLTEPAREVLRRSAVFLGGFTLETLAAVVGRAPAAELDELLEASLVRRQGASRFELLDLVRAFALDELHRSEDADDAHARHRRHFASRVTDAAAAFDAGGAPAELAAPLLADHANLRSALEHAIEVGDAESAVALALGLRPVWLAGMCRQESQELVGRLLASFTIPGAQEIALLRAVAFLDYSPASKAWHRRLAARAAEVGDQEALVTATGNLFGQALNARDPEEMRRLRPELLALLSEQTSAKGLGWIHYFLALDAYVDGRFEAAREHASLSAEKAMEIGHEFMLASAAGTRLLSQSAHNGMIAHGDLVDTFEQMRRPGVPPLAAFALWLAARYAAALDPLAAARWLAHAERLLAGLDAELWPESVLRDETEAVLGLEDLNGVLESTPAVDQEAALSEAAAWLAGREPTEQAPRVVEAPLAPAAG